MWWTLYLFVLLGPPDHNIGEMTLQARFPSYKACMEASRELPSLYHNFEHTVTEIWCSNNSNRLDGEWPE